MTRSKFFAPLLIALAAASASAQDVRLFRTDEAVDPHEVARILDAAHRPMKMRSIRLLDDSPGGGTASAPPAPREQAIAAAAPAPTPREQQVAALSPAGPEHRPERALPSALALPVQFAFDSADILPGARRQLDALAEGIRMLPAIQSVVIEGHTDSRGSDAYNDQLSSRRAYAVKRYLVAVQGIDPGRLRAVGMGKFAPLPGRDPGAPENRRVQFRGE